MGSPVRPTGCGLSLRPYMPQLWIPVESVSFLTGYPRRGLTDSHCFWPACIPIPETITVALGSPVCPDPTLMTLNKSRGEGVRQTADASREVKEQLVVPSHGCPTQGSTSKSKNYPTYLFLFLFRHPLMCFTVYNRLSQTPHSVLTITL